MPVLELPQVPVQGPGPQAQVQEPVLGPPLALVLAQAAGQA
ncbi:hypothetical protein GCM10027580_27170 [Corynebacterium faecale]